MFEDITDPDDERVADYRALTDVELRVRFEPPWGVFIAEGEVVLRRALRAGYRMRSLLVDAKRVDQLSDLDDGTAPCYAASAEVLEVLTGFHVHRGIIASFHRPEVLSPPLIWQTARHLVVMEDVNNHTNIGAIFRSAAGLGADGALLSPTCADPLYRRAIRVSMGEVFSLPYAYAEPWPDTLDHLKEAGFDIVALTPDPGALPIQQLPQQIRRKSALLLGAEGPGLRARTRQRADAEVRIPMRRGVDSLNVAAASAVAMWELTRSDL